MRLALLVFLSFGVVAAPGCTPDPPGDDDTAGSDDDDTNPGDDDDDAASTCAEGVLRNEPVWIDEGGPDTQIHASVAADDEGVWVAYNRPRDDGSGQFDVFVTHIGCDGEVTVTPTRLNDADGANHVDPSVATACGRALIAWHRDDGQFPHNLSIHRAVIEVDGTVATPGSTLVLDDGAYEGNAWMPAAADLPDCGFAVAGARGHEEYGTFQTFVQRLDSDGEPDGATADAAADPVASQTAPALVADDAGEITAAWTRTPIDGDDEAHFTVLGGSSEAIVADAATHSPSLTLADVPVIAATLDQSSSATIVLRTTEADAHLLEIAEAGRFLHSPALAADGTEGAVAVYRLVSGLDNDLFVTRWSRDGLALVEGASDGIDVGDGAPPYAPALAHVVDDVWFVAWSEGENPDYRVRGRFVDFGG